MRGGDAAPPVSAEFTDPHGHEGRRANRGRAARVQVGSSVVVNPFALTAAVAVRNERTKDGDEGRGTAAAPKLTQSGGGGYLIHGGRQPAERRSRFPPRRHP